MIDFHFILQKTLQVRLYLVYYFFSISYTLTLFLLPALGGISPYTYECYVTTAGRNQEIPWVEIGLNPENVFSIIFTSRVITK